LYGGFGIYPKLLGSNPIVYSFGIGEDVSFDLQMIEKYNAQVWGFDPTPKSIAWVKEHIDHPRFHFEGYGISDRDGVEQFYLPQNENYVSGSTSVHSGLKEKPIDVEMRCFSTIIEQIGHEKIDLIKMDIEGSEFEVIPNILEWQQIHHMQIPQFCIEIHGRFSAEDGVSKNHNLISQMNKAGYVLVYVSDTFEELTFITKNKAESI
jgi:FkbM family methyltransferase